jgi:cell fate regulator YaaT (PSP1 superfamily)
MPQVGDYVIVEAERGQDYGQVISEPEDISGHKIEAQLRRVIRTASPQDLKQINENREKTKEAFETCSKKIEEHKLDMKLVEVDYSFDRSKIIFYFTAQGRVDFRNLVKDLARIFKARIELRQIGVRDEAKLFGGFGCCGRELCCARFLKDFEPVTIKMAKEQGLALNPPKLSGVCGRLMCCLSYEYKTYKELSKNLPREGDRINTSEGKGKVISVDILRRKAIVEVGQEGRQIEISFK